MIQTERKYYNGNNFHVVDMSTGEILSENDNHRITLTTMFDDGEDVIQNFQKDVLYSRFFRGNGIMLCKELTPIEVFYTVFFSDFICFNDCVLRTNGNKNGKPLSIQDIADLMGLKYDTVKKVMQKLKNKQIIGYHETGELENGKKLITVNPYIYCRGMNVPTWIRDFYKDSKWADCPRQVVNKKS